MNNLYYGDNLDILRKLVADKVEVDLCYIDPPFNSQRIYNQTYSTPSKTDQAQAQAFVDTWQWDTVAQVGFYEITHPSASSRFGERTIDLFKGFHQILKETRDDRNLLAYLVSITLRLVEIHTLLKPTGSFFLHCDPTASHYLKLVLDSIFSADSFRNEIIWLRGTPRGHAFTRFASTHDVILFYSKSVITTWNENAALQKYNLASLDHKTDHKYSLRDFEGRRFRYTSLINPNPDRPNLTYEFLGVTRVWRWTKDRMQSAYERGEVVQTRPGRVPQYKRYLDEQKGKPIGDVWNDIPPVNSQAQERMGYPTQKPETLLERIITASSNEGDLILDAYCGCGTTIAVSERLRRRWIGIDITFQAIAVILRRMEQAFGQAVLDSIRTDGIPRDLAAAEALANRKDDKTRKEFEKWAVLTYSRNRAVIREKKGADKGIDGVTYFVSGHNETEKMVFQVKSGDVKRNDIATLKGDMEREGAKLATLITLREPTQPMKDEAAQAGIYHHPLTGQTMNRVQIVTVREMVQDQKRLELPMATEVLKTAPKAIKRNQPTLDGLFE
jgi:DNA modification methylase